MADLQELDEQLKHGHYNIEEKIRNLKQPHQEILSECCLENYVHLAKWLIENRKDVDVLHKTESDSGTPLEIASYMGYIDMVKLLLRFFLSKDSAEKEEKRNTTICRSLCECMHRLGTSSEKYDEYNKNTKQCFEEIINLIKKINTENTDEIDILKYKDRYEKTALFYADYYNLFDLKVLLLDTFCLYGNNDGVANIDRLDAETLYKYFNNCTTINVAQSGYSTIVIDYQQLCSNGPNETQFIFTLSDKEIYQHLLEHPLIKCYVFLKREKSVFKFLSYFCITFWLVCTFLNKLISNTFIFFTVVVVICSTHLILNSATILMNYHHSVDFQNYTLIQIAKKLFKKSFPSSFILFTLVLYLVLPLDRRVLIFMVNASFSLKFIFTLPSYGKIFEIVFYRFFKVLSLFTIVAIVPFAVNYESTVPEQQSEGDHTEKTFVFSFYNIFTLLVGELDHFDDSSSSEQKAIFLFFIFTFSIVIVNLLNSLAVNDVQQLEKQADIVRMQDEIRFIYNVEKVLSLFCSLGILNEKFNLFDHNVKKLHGTFNCKENNAMYLSREIIQSLNVFVQEEKELKKKIRIICCCVNITDSTNKINKSGNLLTSVV